MTEWTETQRLTWESRSELPLLAAAVAFLVAYALPILWPGSSAAVLRACEVVVVVSWAAFAVDLAVRLWLAERRLQFLRANMLDVLVVALPLLRPLRLLRLVTVLSALNRRAGGSLRGRVAVYVIGGAAMVLFVASLAVLDADRKSPEASITTFGDAVWWSITTMTTVGYGDRFPVTVTGRLVAVALMLCGIALLGVVTASIASWLIERVAQIEEESAVATRNDVAALAAEVRALRHTLEDRAQADAVEQPT